MRFTSLKKGAAVIAMAALALISAPNLAGATIAGSIGITALGTSTATPDVATATTVSIGSPFFTQGAGTGDLSGIPPGTPLSISATTYTVGPLGSLLSITPFTVSATAGGDTYTFTFSQQQTTVQSHTGSGSGMHSTLTLAFVGTLADSNHTIKDTASGTFTFNQTGGSAAAVGFGATAAHPAQTITTPEPAAIAILGIGLLGLATIRRRPS